MLTGWRPRPARAPIVISTSAAVALLTMMRLIVMLLSPRLATVVPCTRWILSPVTCRATLDCCSPEFGVTLVRDTLDGVTVKLKLKRVPLLVSVTERPPVAATLSMEILMVTDVGVIAVKLYGNVSAEIGEKRFPH